MAFGATKIIPARLVQGDREKIQRTMKVLEQDIARLEKQLAERRSPEGQEATRATILSKRARVHRLNSYLMRSVPHQVRPRRKPIPTTHQSARGCTERFRSEQNANGAGSQGIEELAKAKQLPNRLKSNLQKLPKVTDDASAKKYTEVLKQTRRPCTRCK